MSWLSLFGRPRTAHARRAPLRRHRARPACELLEDRCVPATFNVNTLTDSLNPGGNLVSLRSAIQAANTTNDGQGNVINITVAGVYQITLPGRNLGTNAGGAFTILPSNTNLTIMNTSGGLVTVDAAGIDRAFDINPANANGNGFKVTMQGFTITNGVAQTTTAMPDGPDASGGGIRDIGNISLTLKNMFITGNTATADGGGVVMENLAATPWTLTVQNSIFSNNHAGDAGGGVDVDLTGHVVVSQSFFTGNSATNQGGGIWLDGNGTTATSSLTVTQSFFYGNYTTNTVPGNSVGGALGTAGTGTGGVGVVLTSSTFAANYTSGMGGAFGDQGGGGPLTIVNCTFVSNSSADNGGAIEAAGATTIIQDSTITLNVVQGITASGIGGGVFVTSPAFTLDNTVIANNYSNGPGAGNANFQGMAPDISAAVSAGGGNFIGINDGNLTGITNGTNGNQIGTPAAPLFPRLGPLQPNGGPTIGTINQFVPTMLPLPGSLLIDRGVNGLIPAVDPITNNPITDERGFLRVVGPSVDIGATEFQPSATTVTLTATVNGNPVTQAPAGSPIVLTATIAPLSNAPNNPVTGTVTFFLGNTALQTVPVTNGVATLQIATLPFGHLTLTAVYNGDTNYVKQTSGTLNLFIVPRFTVGAYDPVAGNWYLRDANTAGPATAGQFQFGGFGPAGFADGVVGDWLGTGQYTPAVFYPGSGTWFLRGSNGPTNTLVVPSFQFGGPTDIPIIGDFFHTGHSDVGLYDVTTSTFYLRNGLNTGAVTIIQFGSPAFGPFYPIAGDFSGTGTWTIGLVQLNTLTWFIKTANTQAATATFFQWGGPGAFPVVGDWTGQGHAGIGLVVPNNGANLYLLRNEVSPGFADAGFFAFGTAGWTPEAGQWAPPPVPEMAAAIGSGADSITQAELEWSVAAALGRLQLAGVSPSELARLASINFQLTALPLGQLGNSVTSNNLVQISPNAAGNGWFVDPTPYQDEEFAGETALGNSAAAGKEDLLTVVLHEMGHFVGQPDGGSGLMNGVLPTGTRRTDGIDAVFGS